MAQVKKFQTPAGPIDGTAAANPAGIPAEGKKKYGRWIRDGVVYEMDDESMNNLWEYINSADSNTKMFAADYWKKLQNGEDVEIDTMLNTSNVDPTSVTEKQRKRIDKDMPKERLWDSFANTKRHQYNKTTNYLGQWSPTRKTEEVSKTAFGPGSGAFEYMYDDANKTYSYRDLINIDEMDHFDRIYNYLVNPSTRGTYDTSSFSDLEQIVSWFDNLKDVNGNPSGKAFLDELKRKILAGEEIKEGTTERDFLNTIKIGYNRKPSAEIIASQEAQAAVDDEAAQRKMEEDAAWNQFNVDGIWNENDRRSLFTYDPEKGYTMKTINIPNAPESLGFLFNQEFADRYQGYDYDDLVGKILFDNKWYKATDLLDPNSNLYKILNGPDYNYFNLNKQGKYADANKILMSTWDQVDQYVPNISDATSGYYGNFYNSGNYLYDPTNYNDGTTYYKDENGNDVAIDADNVLLRTIDLIKNDNYKDDGTGIRKYGWTLLDAYGNVVGNYDSNYFTSYYDKSTPKEKQNITPYQRVSVDSTNDYYNYIELEPSSKNIVRSYYNPVNKTYRMVLSEALGGDGQTAFENVPQNVLAILSNKQFLNNLEKPENRRLHQKLINFIKKGKSLSAAELKPLFYGIEGNINILAVAQSIIDYFNLNNRVAMPVQSNKKGGILKAQGGAYVGAGYNTPHYQELIQKANTLNESMSNPHDSRVVRKDGKTDLFGWKNLTNADRAELIALGLDGAGFVGGYVPVYGDAFNAVAGTVANIMNLGVDLHRAKNGQMTTGQALGNFGMGVGADAASIVPIIGDSANAGKWIQRTGNFFRRNKAAIDAVTTTWAAAGLWSSWDSLEKLINGEDMTMNDVKEVAYGLMSIMGLAGKGRRAVEDSRLAARVNPKAKPVSRTTKYTKADGSEGEVSLSDSELRVLTESGTKGEKNIREKLKSILTDTHGIPETEANRIMDDPVALKELGLIHNTPTIGRNTYSAVKPEKATGSWGYFFNPFKRHQTLVSNTPAEIAGGVKSSSRSAYRYINDVKKLPNGYEAVKPGWIVNGRVETPETVRKRVEAETKAREEKARKEAEAVRKAEVKAKAKADAKAEAEHKAAVLAKAKSIAAAKKAKSAEVATTKTETVPEIEPEIVPTVTVEPTVEIPEVKLSPEMEASSVSKIELSRDPRADTASARMGTNHKDSQSFLEALRKELDTDHITSLINDDPVAAREWFDDEIESFIKRKRLDPKSATKLAIDANAMISGKYSFKQGGKVLKCKEGVFGQGLKDFWGGVKKIVEPLTTHDAQQEYLSAARLLLGNKSIDRNTQRSIKGAEDAARLSQQTAPREIYSPQTINAGNASRQFAQSKFQYRPAVTSDSNAYQAWKKQSYDEGNLALANATQLDSQQHSENQLRNTEEKRNYAYVTNEVANQNRKIMGTLATVKSDILNAADTSKTQSMNQYLYQHQAEMDQDRAEALAYKKAVAERQAKAKAQKAFDDALAEKLGGKPFDVTNNNHVAIYQALQKQYASDLSSDLDRTLLQTLTPGAQRYLEQNFKSGGKIRSAGEQISINSSKASDQIRVNRMKAFDRNWSDSNKEVQKAIGRMSDRVHKLIMKMLS